MCEEAFTYASIIMNCSVNLKVSIAYPIIVVCVFVCMCKRVGVAGCAIWVNGETFSLLLLNQLLSAKIVFKGS